MFSIVIPTHNRCQILEQTLQSLAEIDVPGNCDLEVIVVANCCEDRTTDVVNSFRSKIAFSVRVVEESNLGLNHARNRGIQEARGTIVAFLDDDVWVERDWLLGLKEVFAHYAADIVGGKVTLWWNSVDPPPWYSERLEGLLSGKTHGDSVTELKTVGAVIGANFAVRREVFERVGMFRPGLDRTGRQLLGCGEIEFIARALAAGCRIFYAPRASVKHWVAPERATLQYVQGVAFGLGQSQIYMKPKFTPFVAGRAALGYSFLLVKHIYGEWAGSLTNNVRDRAYHYSRRWLASGALLGVLRRLCGTSPVIHK